MENSPVSLHSTEMTTLIGQIDERGYLNGFTKRGYTRPKCLLELVANILDSQDKVISPHLTRKAVFDIQRTHTKVIDNGYGMNRQAITDMFALHRENHGTDASRGVAGIGAKPSLSILSQKSPVFLYTRRMGGEFLCIEVPWDTIHSQGRYTGMIQVRLMTETEQAEFIRERSDNSMMNGNEYHGTTIRFRTNDDLESVICENFQSIQDSELQDPLDRIDIVFGKETTEFIMKHYDKRGPKKLELYNYFKGHQAEFLTGISEDSIEQWSSADGNTHRFIWRKSTGEAWEVQRYGKGWATKAEPSVANFLGLAHVGNYTVKTGFRIDPAIFDPDHPAPPINSSSYGAYVERFIGVSPLNREYVAFSKIYRNNQVLGLVHPELNIGNARANFDAHLETDLVQCEIYFNPISSQDNLQDKAMGTQENKNQFNPTGPPKNFLRLVKAIRHAKAQQVSEAIEFLLPEEEVEEEEEAVEDANDTAQRDTGLVTLDDYIQMQRTNNNNTNRAQTRPAPAPAPAPVTEEDDSEAETEPEVTPQPTAGVRGEELRRRLQQLEETLDDNAWYSDEQFITFYNALYRLVEVDV